jgi:hypothetical protein
MMPPIVQEQAPVPPPYSQRMQAKQGPALHINALTLVTTLHLLALCCDVGCVRSMVMVKP